MKKEDFERLKALCEKNGFEINAYSFSNNSDPNNSVKTLYSISKRDEWEGVEFADNGFTIKKIKSIEKGLVFYEAGSFNHLNECKPSTEQAYVEQLKKEAFERFGEIKVEDRFDISIIREGASNNWKVQKPNLGFEYRKDIDRLLFGGILIYQKGKWATRVPERVNVSLYDLGHEVTIGQKPKTTFMFSTKIDYDIEDAAKFLASQLEKYLNNEI